MMQVRLKLDALQQAFDQRSSERQISHAAHAVSAHTFELESALASGRPFQQELSSLKQVASEDPLLQAILRSLPSNFAVQVQVNGTPYRLCSEASPPLPPLPSVLGDKFQ